MNTALEKVGQPFYWFLIKKKSLSVRAHHCSKRAMKKKDGPASHVSAWAALENFLSVYFYIFLDAVPHSSDSSGPVGSGIETMGGGREN